MSSKTCCISNLKVLTMASEDDNYTTETESNVSFAALDFDSIVDKAEARRVLPWKLVRKKRKVETKPRAVMPSNLHSIVIMDKRISQALRGQYYDYNALLRFIGAALRMQKSHLQKVKKLGKVTGKLVEKPQISDTNCDLFHIGHDAYNQIIGGYLLNRKVYVSGRSNGGRGRNRAAKETRIPRTIALQIAVRNFVRSRHMNRQRVTGHQVLDFFVQQKHLHIPVDNLGWYEKLPFNTAYRVVQK
jgi:hypothetical protein